MRTCGAIFVSVDTGLDYMEVREIRVLISQSCDKMRKLGDGGIRHAHVCEESQ